MDNPTYDNNGVPYYKFPPFPSLTPGTSLVAFKDFRPLGIQMDTMGDAQELDGRGVPTVTLNISHDNTGMLPKAKKRKIKKTAEEVIVGKPAKWWDEWAEGEQLRSSFYYDPMISRTDRLFQAQRDFKASRKWPPPIVGLLTLWDQFRFYIGTLASMQRRNFNKAHNAPDPSNDYDDYDDADADVGSKDMKVYIKPKDPQQDYHARREVYRQNLQKAIQDDPDLLNRIHEAKNAQEDRMELFLNEPELAMKLFFSSWFRHKGLIWSPHKLHDMPTLVLFFFEFIVRNRTFPEAASDIKKAVKIVEKAKEELPLTKKISVALSDHLGQAFVELWGTRHKGGWDYIPAESETNTETEPEEKTEIEAKMDILDVKELEKPGDNNDEPSWASQQLGWGSAPVALDQPEATTSTADSQPAPAIPTTNEWGSGEASSGWGSSSAWNAASSWLITPPKSLLPLLGPSTLPLLFVPSYAETSTRRILSWELPTDRERSAGGGDIWRTCARLVLAPWSENSKVPYRAVRQPQLTHGPDDSGYLQSTDLFGEEIQTLAPKHDPLKDNITVLMQPEDIGLMRKGMGLGGLFVQVVPITGQETSKAGKPGMHKETWWYIERLDQVLVSFWTEPPSLVRSEN